MEVRGWSQAERAHAAQIFERAEDAKHPQVKTIEYLQFLLLLLIIFFGNLCFAALAMPIMLFGSLSLGVVLMFILGICTGMLFVHALRSLKVRRLHHLIGFAFVVAFSFAANTFIIQLLNARFVFFAYSAIFLSLPFVIGMIIPYLKERRLHESS
jgi:hypothetical protein